MRTNINELQEHLTSHGINGPGMSKVQMDNFVFGMQITSHRLAKQFLMELNVRLGSLKSTQLSIEELEAEKEILLEELEGLSSKAEIKLTKVKIKKKEYDIHNLNFTLEQVNQEINNIISSINTYESAIGMKITEVDLNDEVEERKYWVKRLSKQAGLDLLSSGRISNGNMESIMVLQEEERNEVLRNSIAVVHSIKNQMGEMEKNLLENSSKEAKEFIEGSKNNILGSTFQNTSENSLEYIQEK